MEMEDESNRIWDEVVKYYNSGKVRRVLSRVGNKILNRR